MKPSPARDIGVQSFCFRHFLEHAKVAELVRAIGVNSVELSSVHAKFDDVDDFRRALQAYQSAGVRVVSLGVQTFTGDLARERKWFECARLAGAGHISAHFNVDTHAIAVPAAVRLAEEFNIRIGIHCHGGYRFGGSPDVLKYLLDLGGPRIGINIDTAWCMQIGPRLGNPVKWVIEQFPGRIYGVHYKDFVFDRTGQWKDVVIGTGNLDLPAFVTALEKSGFDGMAVLEYEGDVENPVPALMECVKAVRGLAV